MRRSIIVAMGENRVIGREGRLPWRLPADLRRFKELTMGHHLIMGRKTYESIGRPLPGRTMIVVSRSNGATLDEAFRAANGDDEVFIAGGAEIYRQTLSIAERIYLTLVHESFDGDALFPEVDFSQWKLVSREDHEADEKNRHRYSFLVYDRV